MIGRADGKHAGGVLRVTADMAQHGARPVWLGVSVRASDANGSSSPRSSRTAERS